MVSKACQCSPNSQYGIKITAQQKKVCPTTPQTQNTSLTSCYVSCPCVEVQNEGRAKMSSLSCGVLLVLNSLSHIKKFCFFFMSLFSSSLSVDASCKRGVHNQFKVCMLSRKGCILLETNASLKELLLETDNALKSSHERQEVSSFTTTPHFCKFF
jgi:hypothetical protein